jgi:hypothetical protein
MAWSPSGERHIEQHVRASVSDSATVRTGNRDGSFPELVGCLGEPYIFFGGMLGVLILARFSSFRFSNDLMF